jgi:hypothetical protein
MTHTSSLVGDLSARLNQVIIVLLFFPRPPGDLLLSSLFITYRSYGTCLICVRYRGLIRVKEKFFLPIT